jgi:uncharacterized protein
VNRGRTPLPEPDLGGVGWILAAAVGGYLVAGLLVGFSGAAVNSPVYNVLSFVGLWAGFVGVPIYLSRTRGTGRLSRDFGLRFGGPADVGLGLLGGLCAYGAVAVYSAVIQALGDHANLGREANQLSGHGLGPGFVAFALGVAVGAPIAEELFFRGLTQPVLQRRLGDVGGLALTAVLFGFAHLGSNPIEAVLPLAFFGAVVGLLAWRTGRLGPGIVAHMTFNGITVIAIALSR